MSKRKGNPKKSSEFICLRCLRIEGCTCNGLQRIHNMRKENHVKNQWCAFCKEEVKALEIREKDFYCEKRVEAEILHEEYYGGDNYGWIGSKRCRI